MMQKIRKMGTKITNKKGQQCHRVGSREAASLRRSPPYDLSWVMFPNTLIGDA